MENAEGNIISTVKSPAKTAHLRIGCGFSLAEIKAAGKTIALIKQLNIKIDYNRRSTYKDNVELLKAVKPPKKKGAKRPYAPKEKVIKREKFKPKAEKEPVKKTTKKKETVVKEEPKTKPTKAKKAPAKAEAEGIPLSELSGLGPATVKKFQELGVENVADLCKEKPKELSMLIKGCSEDRIKKWIEEGKEKLKE